MQWWYIFLNWSSHFEYLQNRYTVFEYIYAKHSESFTHRITLDRFQWAYNTSLKMLHQPSNYGIIYKWTINTGLMSDFRNWMFGLFCTVDILIQNIYHTCKFVVWFESFGVTFHRKNNSHESSALFTEKQCNIASSLKVRSFTESWLMCSHNW